MLNSGILTAPFSVLTYAPSMGGKTEYWLGHLLNLTIFDPKPTRIHCFGHLNLAQFDRLKDRWGSDFVDVNYVKDLPGFEFEQGAFVLVDELNSSVIGVKKKVKESILDSVAVLYNERCHHLRLYVCVLCQEVIRNDCFRYIGLSQSICLSTMNGKSLDLLRYLSLGPDALRQATATLRMLRHKPEFLLIFHIPPASASVIHRYMWTYLRHFPNFAIAIGDQSLSVLPRGRKRHVEMDSEHALDALGEFAEAHASQPDLAGQAFAFVPLESLREESPKEEAEQSLKEPEDAHSTLNSKVLEMLAQVCSVNEFSTFKKFWFYLRFCPFIGINSDGTVLYYKGKEINSLTFIRECCKKSPPPQFASSSKPRKLSDVLKECVPFAAQLLKDKAFPPHLICNALLYKLAKRYEH